MVRQDYVANSNASHWLTNPDAPMTGYSPLNGGEAGPQNARTRIAHSQIHDLVAQGQRVSSGDLKEMLFSNRNYMAELILDDVLAICAASPHTVLDGAEVDLQPACGVLAAWDRRDGLPRGGAALFREFLKRVPYYGPKAAAFWRIPFDVADPIGTPRGVQAGNKDVAPALAQAVQVLEKAGVAIDAPLGQVQFVTRGGQRIPIHGGADSSVFNVMQMPLVDGKGYTDPVFSGATYVAVIGFDENGPVADAIMASGQTTDESDSLALEGVQAFSDKRWTRLPFSDAAIRAAAIGEPIRLYRD
jgi:acyl-homoserine-lactone acylase